MVVYLFWMLLCKFYNIVKCDVFDGVFCVISSVNGDGVFMWINCNGVCMSINIDSMCVCICVCSSVG